MTQSRKRLPTTTDPCGATLFNLPDDRDEGQYVGRVDYQMNANQTIFDQAPPGGTQFGAGRVAFYNYSQPNVEYGFDDGTVPNTTTTTAAPTTPSTTIAGVTSTTQTNVTVGQATKSTLVRTGQSSLATTLELVAGALLIALGAGMSATRGKRPEGRFYA